MNVPHFWYGRSKLAWLLLPFSLLFGLIVAVRRWAYQRGFLRVHRLRVPVIVVGNLTVGGTGKTPVARWLVEVCRVAGYRPGIVSRGYGGRRWAQPHLVAADDSAAEVGDEPLLLQRQTGVPVCVHSDRPTAGRRLLDEGVDVVIADDGLQHYALGRDIEIVVIDGRRRLGNGFLMPAGPLREPPARLASTDFVLVNGGPAAAGETAFVSGVSALRSLDGSQRVALDYLRGKSVRVLAGIGDPARFYQQLTSAGLRIEPIPVADHGHVDLATLCKMSSTPILMTEKDAVKYGDLDATLQGCAVWVAVLGLQVPDELAQQVLDRLNEAVARRARATRTHRSDTPS